MLEIVVLLIAASPFITIPWGWNRWFAEDRRWNTPSTLSFAGLLLASLSAFVVIAALVWSGAGGDFPTMAGRYCECTPPVFSFPLQGSCRGSAAYGARILCAGTGLHVPWDVWVSGCFPQPASRATLRTMGMTGAPPKLSPIPYTLRPIPCTLSPALRPLTQPHHDRKTGKTATASTPARPSPRARRVAARCRA